MLTALLPAVLAGLATLVLLPAPADRRLGRLVPLGGHPPAAAGMPSRPSAAVPALRRLAAVLARRREVAAVRAAVLEIASALVVELRAGLAPEEALRTAVVSVLAAPHSAATRRVLLPLARAPLVDGADALRAAARAPGARGLLPLSVCWEVTGGTGGRLADAVDRVVDGLRADDEVREEVAAALAAPRASAVVLVLLPVVGLALGAGLGADPLHVLLGSPLGWVCLVAGLGLEALGWWWTERLARAAEPA